MAAVATQFSVSPIEPEFRPPIMLEIPRLPRSRVVASVTAATEAFLVHVLLCMAVYALSRCVAELWRVVALFAFRFQVPACQRETASIVIERCILPPFLGMTVLTSRPELPFVFVILSMAAHAINLHLLLVHRSLVAFSAFGGLVLSAQNVSRVQGMIEMRALPGLRIVAVRAFLAVSAVVCVISLVTAVARGR